MRFTPTSNRRGLNRALARDATVQTKVRSKATRIANAATTLLAGYRDTGNARIEVEYDTPDALVSLVDPSGNALAIEFGHRDKRSGKYVEGLYVLTRAL